ncbi:hypothetical protein HNQ94_001126 [Salirhabdus euzebyi]|uniref:HXXEE domain-containing protein n=1 Tax=Salirhabdus euzebyi TaxID=394506 RepID=A0A841PV47_9BACI|nr:HXXEE domain-containing protein [Salirhabdus euzebyi]MBB6452680.1 hypothetical protein [Salirhabdus euzebyi]
MESLYQLHTLIWLFPVMFIFHDFEEIILVEGWIKKNKSKIKDKLPNSIADKIIKQLSMSTAQFSVSVLIIFLFVSSSTYMASQYIQSGSFANIHFFIVCNLIFFLHAFTHIGQSIFFRGLTPGALTSMVVIIPYSIFLFDSLIENNILSWNMIWSSIPFVFLVIPVLLVAHGIGKRVIS